MLRAFSMRGRDTLSPFWTLFWILVCLHQLYYGWFLIRSSFVPYVMDGNETFSVWWHAHNLYSFSFWKSFGLTDESYGVTEGSHPFFHTHQGNMPRLFGFLIYALGARTVEAQVVVTTLIIGNLTLYFCYASIAKITRPAIAFVFCVLLFSDYLLYAQWHVVTYRVWYGFLFFGTWFAIVGASEERKVWPYLLLGTLFFLLFYFELIFAAYVSVIAGFLGLWLHWGKPKRIVALYAVQAAGLVAGIGLLFGQLVLAMGLDVVKADFTTTFLARNAAANGASIESIGEFFRNHNIVFWMNFRDGAVLRSMVAFARSIGVGVFQVWTPAFFILVCTPLIGVIVSFLERRPRPCVAGLSAGGVGQGDAMFGFGSAVGLSPDRHVQLVRYAGLATLVAGAALVLHELLTVGLVFGMVPSSPYPGMRFVLLVAMVALLLVMFVGHLYPPAVKVVGQSATFSLLAMMVAALAVIIFEVPMAQGLADLTASRSFDLILVLVLMGAGLALGHLASPSLLPVVRGAMTSVLIAILIARSYRMFDQNYSDVWLMVYQNAEMRMLVRVAILLAAAAGIAFAVMGARQSFGGAWKTFIGRSLVLFTLSFAGYATIYVLSPGYVFSGYVERLAPFAIFFLMFIPAIAICAIAVAGCRYSRAFTALDFQWSLKASRIWVPVCVVFAIATTSLLWIKVQVYYAKLLPSNYLIFARTLTQPPFKGASFAVNNYAAVVAYYTRNWAYIDAMQKPSIDPKSDTEQRLTDRSYHWFADWSSNSDYRYPQYYACMKMQSFDTALALRDPSRSAGRFLFCDSETEKWRESPFNDKVVAADTTPARYWSIVELGKPRPRIEGIETQVQLRDDGWLIQGQSIVRHRPEAPITSRTFELLVGTQASCSVAVPEMKVVQTSNGDVPFKLPSGFHGGVRVRARVESADGVSEPKFGNVWVSRASATEALTRCPNVLAAGSFTDSNLSSITAGWGGREAWGVWTVGRRATLPPLPLSGEAVGSDFMLEAVVRSFLPGAGKEQSVRVLANGEPIANWVFSAANSPRVVTARIPRSVLTGHPSLQLSFEIASPTSPVSLGASADSRALGIGLEQLTIKEIQP
ncbi:hypothetical protein [Tardiphaga sp. 42S5]|uniref:hypothetical protein n=1 Tax=Tardiphaga sp. 42S5 TaxID=1404799 RepID=UPI002A5AEB93|nr:hypothetical protein [Tardiphaga sp. 42S5]WPO44276.1 hypothetical protein SFY93_14465 [Tardiphaga sp. 42S5]